MGSHPSSEGFLRGGDQRVSRDFVLCWIAGKGYRGGGVRVSRDFVPCWIAGEGAIVGSHPRSKGFFVGRTAVILRRSEVCTGLEAGRGLHGVAHIRSAA